MKKFKVKESCQSCNGTGLYVGMGERDGSAVVCHTCKGTGCHIFIHEYEEFTKRKAPSKKITRVFETNPGICIGGEDLKTFGGMPYEDWKKAGFVFPERTEMRKYICPAWWYQCADYDLKPKWDKCQTLGIFSSCPHFDSKNKCWVRWDKENQKKS